MIIFNFFKYLYIHLKYYNIIKKVYKEESFIDKLSQMFNIKFKKDWIGRLYAVINPNISTPLGDQVFEYNEKGLDNKTYIEKWVMDRMNVLNEFIQSNNLFDVLTYNIKKLDDYDNYLFIIQPITLDDCLKWTKRFFILLFALVLIFGIISIFI